MNLRKAGNYSIGLDIGTASVGWAVVDENGVPFSFNGRPTLGARLFPEAETAANRRTKRALRRRYERRRQRLQRLQEIFDLEMAKIDPEFFIRLRQSSLLREDRDPGFNTNYRYPFFNSSDFTEKDYYKKFPTIWHLRAHLMQSDEKADIRLIYLALHNIVKYRGHFIREDEKLSAANADSKDAAIRLSEALEEYFSQIQIDDDFEISCLADVDEIEKALDKQGVNRSQRAEGLEKALAVSRKDMGKQISRACVGLEVEFSKIFTDLEKGDGSNHPPA